MAEEELKVIPLDEGAEEIRGRGGAILGAPRKAFSGFIDFVRERGVMGLAIGFVLGSAVQKVVTAFVNDLLNPIIGIILGEADGLKNFKVGTFLIGDFISVLLDFIILALLIFTIFKVIGLEKMDKPKS